MPEQTTAFKTVLFHLEIIPPPSLVNQVPIFIEKYSLTLQQPQLLDLIDA
jgi:hypothetical protein